MQQSGSRSFSPVLVDSVTILVGSMHSGRKMQLDGNSLAVPLGPTNDDMSRPGERMERHGLASAAPRAPIRSAPPHRCPSFERIYEDHFDMVFRALSRHGVAKTQLEDAIQEVFVTVHDRWSSFEGRSSVRTWIYGIARRIARDYRPDARLVIHDPLELDEAGGACDLEPLLEQLDAARLLYSLLAQLDPDRQEIVVLVELEQMTVAEAAEILDENPNTLQSRLKQAREELTRAYQRRVAEQAWRRQCATKTQR